MSKCTALMIFAIARLAAALEEDPSGCGLRRALTKALLHNIADHRKLSQPTKPPVCYQALTYKQL